MRSRFRSESSPDPEGPGGPVELVRVRRAQRVPGDEGYNVKARTRRRGGRGRRRGRNAPPPPPRRKGLLAWISSLFGGAPGAEVRPERREAALDRQESRVLAEFAKQYGITFRDSTLLKLALTHRSYLSVTGQGPRESNERLEFLGDSVLGLVTSEYLYRRHPDEHEGQLTKIKSLLVSKAILSRRALRMGLGRFVLMSHSEVESGGRQRLSILADAFESVLGAIYLDQGFETARQFIHRHLLAESDEIMADKRHTNYKSHLQEYVQSTYRTHPVYRIRSEYGPDHSKHFMVEVMVGRRTLGEGRGHNKKEAEQAAARDALESVKRVRGEAAPPRRAEGPAAVSEEDAGAPEGRRRRRRRGGRGRSRDEGAAPPRIAGPADALAPPPVVEEYEAEEDEIADEQELDLDEAAALASGESVEADEVDDLDDDTDEEVEDDLDDEDEEEDDEEVDEEVDDDLDDDEDEEAAGDHDEGEDDEDEERVESPKAPLKGHEELHVDPYDLGATSRTVPAPGPEPGPSAEEKRQRALEIERAMSSFGQRQPERYGRRGRPGRKGR